MAELIFTHPRVRILHKTGNSNIKEAPSAFTTTQSVTYASFGKTGSTLSLNDIRPNQILWTYGLNTQSYPTYAGEVVQILSAYVDNLTINGDLRSYSDMELFYKWFIRYMTIATQGSVGTPTTDGKYRYDDTPVLMEYPHRNWRMYIRPLSLPTMTYGTDVVVPNWSMEAAVVEDENLQLTKMLNSDIPALVQQDLGTLDANFGRGVENPFNYWSGNYNQADINKFLGGNKPILNADPNNTQLQDWFQNLVVQYASGNVDLAASNTPYSVPYTKTSDVSNTIIQNAGSNTPSLGGSILGGLAPPLQSAPGNTPTSISSPKTPAGVVQAAQIALGQAANYVYSEQSNRGNGGNLYGPKPNYQDCSSFVTLCFKAAGYSDPNNFGYNPIGDTYSLLPNCTKVPLGSPQAGDLYFWSGPDHVALAIDGNGNIIEMVGPGLTQLTVGQESPEHTSFLGCYHPNVYGA